MSHGVILDDQEATGGHFPIAIKSGIVKSLLSCRSDNEYRKVLEELVLLGVIEGELEERTEMIDQVKEKSYESDDGNPVRETHHTTYKSKKRIDKRRSMGKSKEANVFTFIINSSLLEGIE